ncbi:ATP-binding cassette domain-containing protein [Halosegnis rubeus]|jgi:iron(III) transport system ATP-binding protein|uniref:Molybdate/tungstate import ATP-binding protein WtpC n=1 Tax=Halosegnis rubeus TaxID=2212850 RepID=A0A5N5U336_9EURY|nr:ABC transporter ATP-binding protein [Halosegnis rubeus]KAB7512849.1 ATP-binding cassette domain-containing protein [Halosegnis rubeus]KAB7512965.1 ATP-binding cassette domain-containing protein [Halosegnis rubeus]KAB7513704.1 ATP-binding cassette domain-containing protein [Halosegnis rubeus]
MSNDTQQFRQPTTDDSPRFEQDTRTTATQDGDPVLRLRNVTKRFGDATAVSGLDLTVRDGELLTLLGPSGCGKTTTLRMIAGLEAPSDGTIRVGGTTVADGGDFTKPEDRDVGLVFQEFALFPHLSVAENIAFGLAESDPERVQSLLDLVGLSEYGDRSPTDLSGGERQRVALARSLAPEPDVLLLDEPFSNLDVRLRVEMREEVRRILKETGVTAVSVTHDQEEAMSISDRVAVMYEGQLEQVDTPERVFQQPRSRFVASFLGHASFVSGRVEGDTVETGLGPIGRTNVDGLATEYDGSEVDIMLRPDDVVARPADASEANGRAVHRRFLGPTVLYRVDLDSGDTVGCMHNHDADIPLNEPIRVDLDVAHDLAWFPSGSNRTPDAE